MTPEQYKAADLLQKQINNHTGIFNLLHDASNSKDKSVEIKSAGRMYSLSERLINEFMHATQHSLNKLQEEFNGL